MKKLIYSLLIACFAVPAFLYGIGDSRIRQSAVRLHTDYPAATLQDLYKTCYQDFWGAEHMVPDSAAAARYLAAELEEARTDTMLMPDCESCGWRHRYQCLSLAMVLKGELSEEQLLSAFLTASDEHPCWPLRKTWLWKLEWHRICRTALKTVPEWHDENLEAELAAAAEEATAVHHSLAFREAYHPHYRISIR